AMSSEGDPQMKPSNDRLELRVPIEIQTPSQEGSMTASRGYVLLRLDDPAYIAKLNTQRAEARKAIQDNKLSSILSEMRSQSPPSGTVPWKVVGVMSDMKVVSDMVRSAGPGEMAPGQLPNP
ncbi:MAG: hypothetical protein ACRCZF_26350, partial [Gemmataceae bacterium]